MDGSVKAWKAGELSEGLAASAEAGRSLASDAAEGRVALYGLHELDWHTKGMWPGDLTLLLGAPSVGKSALALQVARRCSGPGTAVALFSLEHGAEFAALRMVAAGARVALQKAVSGCYSDGEAEALAKSAAGLSTLDLWVFDADGLGAGDLAEAAAGVLGSSERRLVVVDGAKRLRLDGDAADAGAVASYLKQAAERLKAPVLATMEVGPTAVQAVRSAAARFGAVLELEPRACEAADVVMALDRSLDEAEADERGAPALNTAEFVVAKDRRSEPGCVTLGFVPDYALFAGRAEGLW